ncbi:MAG: S9 family peptidase [Chloroflexi bacterium]|nr:S9 family peptidase [Chloroflexota bacterium]
MIDLERLLRVPYVDPENGYDISFDGERAAFSWNLSGQWEIYEVALRSPSDRSTRSRQRPRLVSSGTGAKSAPLYSPDGTRLVYGVDFDGSENMHILVCDLATGAQTDLTPGSRAAILPYFVWSPDSKEIAFISDASGHFCTYAMPASGGAPCLILDEEDPARAVHWSPNGRWLSVSVEARGQDYHTFIVPAGGGEAHPISGPDGALNVRHAGWSVDGERLVFSAVRGDWYDIGIYEVREHRVTWITAGEGDKIYPDLCPDGKRVAYVLSLGAATWLAVQELGGETRLFQVEPGVHYAPIFTPDSQHVLLTFDNPRHPTNLWLLSLADGKFTQLTHSLPPDLAEFDFAMPEEVWYPGLDGVPVPALLFRSTSPQPGPAVVLIHGGPTWLFQMTWYPLMLHMASRGWTVLTPGFRGSTGYGHAWQTASRFDLGGVDTRDCAAGAMYLARQGLADPRRIAVTGRSHGGYLTMTCLTQFPELWAGGSAVVPFMNWFTSHAHLREDFQHWDIENMGDPNENHDRWYANSPYFFLDRLRAPVQLICAENDPRCPVEDSMETREKLKSLGKDVDFILYRDEGHAFLKMENLVDSETRRVAFLEKYLM